MDANLQEMKRSLGVLFQPGDTIELRTISDSGIISNGYYRDQEKLAADAAMMGGGSFHPPQNIYVLLNPVKPALFAKRADKIARTGKGGGSSDPDAMIRRWLLVDLDPRRDDSKISASDEERQAAHALGQQVYGWLREQLGANCLIVADSGNGLHIAIRLPDLANDEHSRRVCERFLAMLGDRFDTPAAKVDRTTFNASRICTLWGSVKRKGDHVPGERPHRQSRLLHVPADLQPVDWQQLLGLLPSDQQHSAQPQIAISQAGAINIDELLGQRQIEYSRDADYRTASGETATRWQLHSCPWEPEHSGSAYIIQFASGAIAAGCLGDRCAGKGWADLQAVWQLPRPITASDIILPAAQPARAMSSMSSMSFNSYINPPAIPAAAFYGPLGSICRELEQQTEASPIAVLACSLLYLGNLLGRRFYCQLDQWHFAKLYVALVGATGSGRKGTADHQARRIIDAIDPTAELLRHSGLSTGEGMLELLDKNREGIYPRPAVFTEREFAGVFRRAERKGNTLSTVIRDAWDDTVLENSTKANPVRIADHHVSLCVHVTPAELIRLLSNLDCANGFANRFIWIYSRRSERRPNAPGFQAARFSRQLDQLRAALDSARQRFQQAGSPICLPFSQRAAAAWESELYPALDLDSEDDTQLILMCNRQPQHVCRIALILALADGLPQIDLPHLQAAQALIGYCWESLDYILSRPWWGDASNPHDAAAMGPRIQAALADGPKSRSYILHRVFNRNRTAKELNAVRDLMHAQGLVRIEQTAQGETWHAL